MKFGVVADSFGMPYIPSMVMNGPGSTHFGFINIVRNQRTNDHRIVSNLVSIPYVTVPKEILQVTKRLNAEPLLRDFQSIFALINHDWYHAMTPLIINPYYGNKGYELSETPYGVHFERREEKLIPRGRGSAVTTVINERHEGYVFSELDENGYESLGLIVQAEAFQRLYQNPSMQGYIDSRLEQFFKKVGQLGFDIRYMSITPRDEHKTLANQAQHYFSTLMMHHLLRVVPVDHPLFKKCEGWINDHCDIDKSFLKNDTFERVIRRSKKSTADISAVTGLQAPSPLKSTDLEEQVADHKDIQRRRNLKLPQKTAEPEVKRSSLLAPFIEIARDVRGGLKEMDFSVRVAASIPKLYRLTKKWTTAEHIRWAAWEQSFDHHGSIHTPSYLKFRESAPRAMQLLMDAVFDDWHKAVGQHQKPQPQPAH
ncbi:MAG: hypothetical protein EBQ96_03940 [Proteobacteria bacterium]|nr:hypothetical protein [Pseudomonadota bacterium]